MNKNLPSLLNRPGSDGTTRKGRRLRSLGADGPAFCQVMRRYGMVLRVKAGPCHALKSMPYIAKAIAMSDCAQNRWYVNVGAAPPLR